MRVFTRGALLFLASLSLVPAAAHAQASIAGVVKDTSGAVLPGVTVEASSPSLIEKTRSVVTDGSGQYKIVDLRPGAYVVTFSLPGFNTVKREGIELTGSFVATVNADLKVGAVEETITVTGETPIVDVQSTTRQRVLDHEIIDNVPASRIPYTMAVLIPGVTAQTASGGTTQDVGGVLGNSQSNTLVVHGSKSTDLRLTYNGIWLGTLETGQNAGAVPNSSAYQEVTVDTSGVSAELSTGGPRINLIPREGGNAVKGTVFYSFVNNSMQGTNLTQELKSRGLAVADSIKTIRDFNPGFGGPIKKDKLWYFASFRDNVANNYAGGAFYNRNERNPNAWTYVPDTTRQASNDSTWRDTQIRLTWQVNPKNKLALSFDHQWACQCPSGISATTAPESATPYNRYNPKWGTYVDWSAPVTSRLLLEAVVFGQVERVARPPERLPLLSAVTEQSNLLTFRAMSGTVNNNWNRNIAYRGAVSYITGAHALKIGFNNGFGYRESTTYNLDSPMSFRFNNGVPNQITLRATPFTIKSNLDADLGIYGQDKWTLNRLTLTGGVRFDYYKSSYPSQHFGPVPFAPTVNLDLAPTTGVVGWKDITPKMGAAYDLAGNGKTALKVSLNKYVAGQPLGGTNNASNTFGASLNPISRLATSTTRSWNDSTFTVGDSRRGNLAPDCDLFSPLANGECGAIGNAAFGTQVLNTSYDPAILAGWGSRAYNWEFATGVQHAILPRVSVDLSYFRRWYGNFIVTDNTLAAASDYTRFQITAPADARLPGGGGYLVGGLYDLNPNKVGQVSNYVTFADNYGTQIEHWNGLDFTVNARLEGGLLLQGGVSSGRTNTNNCEVIDKLPEMLFGATVLNVIQSGATPAQYCSAQAPFLTQLKVLGVYTVPKIDVLLSATVQSLPEGVILANFTATNAIVSPSLGRNLSGGAANVVVNLVRPGTMYGDRLNQLDLRVGKILRFHGTRASLNFDVYNATNANTVLTQNAAYASWLTPTSILTPRFFKVGFQFDF